MEYRDLIEQFLYSQVPTLSVKQASRFEVIVDTIIGTKQLRQGPRPSPEIQVSVRDVVRQAQQSNSVLNFFVPWASRKQVTGAQVDVLEFMALKQLHKLRSNLKEFGVETRFTFRLEDLTDAVIFNEMQRRGNMLLPGQQILDYRTTMVSLLQSILPESVIRFESHVVPLEQFKETVEQRQVELFSHLTDVYGGSKPSFLKHQINADQRAFYIDLYRKLYPYSTDADRLAMIATYFACVVARREHGALGVPTEPYVFVTFSHPIPNDPVQNNRLYYRTLPEKYTHQHRAPWLAQGYFEISDRDNSIVPRYVTPEVENQRVKGVIPWEGVSLCADYVVV